MSYVFMTVTAFQGHLIIISDHPRQLPTKLMSFSNHGKKWCKMGASHLTSFLSNINSGPNCGHSSGTACNWLITKARNPTDSSQPALPITLWFSKQPGFYFVSMQDAKVDKVIVVVLHSCSWPAKLTYSGFTCPWRSVQPVTIDIFVGKDRL